MINLVTHPEGMVIHIRVQPGARRDRIVGEHAGALKLSVTQPPEKGKANQAVIAMLSAALSLKKSQVRVVSGETSRDKRILVVGMKQAELRERIAQLGEDGAIQFSE